MGRGTRYPAEVRERAVRIVQEHVGEYNSQWAAIESVAEKIGCNPETLRKWLRQAERDQGKRRGLTPDERQRAKELEREVRELRRADEILRRASASFPPGGARPPRVVMVSFIDAHRRKYGVEAICRQLPMAASTYYEQLARRADPDRTH
jgi:transposase-like protein